ncbi:MAG TPA: signal recognition particle-docking protein FtsY [Egibacteraceae bacterium]|nr:signal recognition particle-docking protein FtsY [Egibacteraceae bacterium]
MEPLILAVLLAVALVGVVIVAFTSARRRRGVAIDETMRQQLEQRAPEQGLPPDDTTDEATVPDQAVDVEPDAGPTVAEPEKDVESAPAEKPAVAEAPAPAEAAPPAPPAPLTARERFIARLTRARNSLGVNVASIFGRGITEEAWEELEESLIAADVGVEATMEIVESVRSRAKAEGARTGEDALRVLKETLREELSVGDRSLRQRSEGTSVWLVTGVNGTGKTTSIGKLAARHTRAGQTVVLAAADTFRAAAAEQLQLWGERAGARVVAHQQGADPAAVAFDGYQAAKATDADVLMVDTAGRLQNKTALMAELGKVKRVMEKAAGPCDEVLLVLDATTGQNGLSQARAFLEAVDVTGVVLTKLDGTAKGGIVVAIQRALGLPVKLVGLGEDVDDLADFDGDAFVEALFAEVVQEVDVEADRFAGGAAGAAG